MITDSENFNATLETCSVLGHDISGQLHVLQFCAEELAEANSDDPHLQRILKASDELTSQVKILRSFLKKSLISEGFKSLYDIYEESEMLLRVHQPKDYKRVLLGVDQNSSSVVYGGDYRDILNPVFVLLNFIVEELKEQQLDNCRINISGEGNDSQVIVSLKISDFEIDFSKLEDHYEEPSFARKTIRKSLGHTELFHSEKVKFNFDNNNEQEVHITFDL